MISRPRCGASIGRTVYTLVPARCAGPRARAATIGHIQQTVARVDRLRASTPQQRQILRAALLVHELSGPALETAIRAMGALRHRSDILFCLAHFGTIWHPDTNARPLDLGRQSRLHLRLYLLFELVHEGSAPPGFHTVWKDLFPGCAVPQLRGHRLLRPVRWA